MSAAGTGAGGCGPGPGAGPGASNPRKFSEKIALHTQRQAEETAAFQEVMMDITSTRIQAQKVRLARTQGPYYGGSLPNVNQIGRNPSDFQGSFHSNLDSIRSTRHHGLVERVQRDRRFISPVRPYRRQTDSSQYNSPYLSPPPDPSWRRNWSSNFPLDKSQLFQLPTTALNRTNSDSALHTSVMNPSTGENLSSGHGLTAPNRRSVFPFPVPPIEENMVDEGKLLKPWDTKKLPLLSSRPKSCEVPGINVFPSPDQQSCASHIPSGLNTGGSLPDLTSLHFPSPLPTPLDPDEPCYTSLSGGSSTGNLANTLTQLGITTGNAFHLQGLSASMQGPLNTQSLQSSLSNPNIQSSLSSHSFPACLSPASLHSSLSNPSLQSSLSSSPSLPPSLNNSSLGGKSLQPSAGNLGYGGGGVGVPSSCASSYPPLLAGQGQPRLCTSPRRRAQLSPLILPGSADARRHHSKQFSPTVSPTLSSITQGVPLDTSKLPMDQRLPPYSYSPAQQPQTAPSAPHQSLPKTGPAGQPAPQHQQLNHQQLQAQAQTQLHGQNLPNPQKTHSAPGAQMQQLQRPAAPMQAKGQNPLDIQGQNCQHMQQDLQDAQTRSGSDQQGQSQQSLSQLQQMNHQLVSDMGACSDASLLNSLLDDPCLDLHLAARQALSQQFNMEPQVESLSFNHSLGSGPPASKTHEGSFLDQVSLDFQDSGDQQLLNSQNQTQSFGGMERHGVPNIILTGDSPTGLSKEITSALSGVPGFELDSFSLDDPLRIVPMSLEGLGILSDADLMLSDPSVEDSFRSDRLK
ncbi:CREB-regulated transcription coactivator 2 isoform X2 [Brienomyrus brachyistius]|uniref:CREB-regulated transcription coactivator 2 isoform X2 n=1 Tax=Brienomyrus brachyistius TaxID=42636 RepID=UPI0020B19F3B|nr:CREB-regulated transcription coactivator 2 isoform X2 [Brienomyrus brachyistius]